MSDDEDTLLEPSDDDVSEPALDEILALLAAGPPARTWTLLNQRVGRYEVIGGLGRGGMGEVYRARDPELGRDVALKVLQPDAGVDLLEEARAAARLTSPFIASVYDVLNHDGRPVIAMKLVEGPSLWALLRAQPLSASQAVVIARGVAEALAVAHGAGVVHRDVKPGNILLRADGHPLLVDFGLATSAGTASVEGGTPQYAAPEQKAGAPPSPAADVYAFGVTLDEMLEVCDAPPPALRELARACTREAPDERPPDGAALVERLTPRPRSAGVAVVALIALLALVSGIPMLVSSFGPRRPPSIESIPTVTDDRQAQRSFVLAVQAVYAGDREAAARALGPVLEADPVDPAAWLLAAHLPPSPSTSAPSPELKLKALARADDARAPLAAFASHALALKPWAPGQNVPDVEAAALVAEGRALIDASPDAWFDHLLIILSLPRAGDQHTRLALLDELERVDDGPPMLALARAWALQHLARDDEARDVLKRAVAAHPGNDALARELAVLLLDDDPAAAIAAIEPIVLRRPQDGVLRFSLAEAYLRASDERWQGVLDDLFRGGFDPFLVGRGTLMFSEAVSALGRPDLADARRRMGLARLAALDAIDEAAGGYRRAVLEAIERHDLSALDRWLKEAEAFVEEHRASPALAMERLQTTIDAGRVHALLAGGDKTSARQQLEALKQRSAPTFGPDLTRERVLAALDAGLAAAEGRRDDALKHLDEASAGGGRRDLQHPPPALLAADLKRAMGMKDDAAADYRVVLERRDDCLAATLYWEVRCRRDLVRAADGLLTLQPDAPEADTWRTTRQRAQPLAAGPSLP